MKTNQTKYNEEVVKGFQNNKGKGSVYCFSPISYADTLIGILTPFFERTPDEQVFIVVDCYNTRKSILERFEKDNLIFNVKILSADYIKPNYSYNYRMIITVGINDNIELLSFLNTQCKFMLSFLTKNVMNNQFIAEVRSILPEIVTTVTNVSVANENLYSPVEEYRISVGLSDEDQAKYDKYGEFITTSINVFGDISNIEKCRSGDPIMNISAAAYREALAHENGWNLELDTSIEWSKRIDDAYNPNMLLERANTFFTITKQRKDLVTDNYTKLSKIGKICIENDDKKILIVSKRGDFASDITKYLNLINAEMYPGTNTLKCGNYHDSIESQPKLDMYGQAVLIKSGAKKGEPVIMGAQAISTLNMSAFNNSDIQVLSIKNSSSNKLQIACDIIIFTTPFIDDIIAFKSKFTNIVYKSNPTILYKVYCRGTIESKRLSEQKDSPLIRVIDDEENYIGYDETNFNELL